jgi:putative toxin-antitoxin system antitoxin component (TIGR02293 family)
MADKKYKYPDLDDNANLNLANDVSVGYGYSYVANLPVSTSFSQKDWSEFLHISERTIIRYREQNKKFDPLQTDRIIHLNQLYIFGIDVFGDENLFNLWLSNKNLALGGRTPKELLTTSFGINMVNDEIGRIAHGVLA